MKAGLFLDINQDKDSDKTNLKAYQSLIGKLIYLAYSTRPDISYIIRYLQKNNSDP